MISLTLPILKGENDFYGVWKYFTYILEVSLLIHIIRHNNKKNINFEKILINNVDIVSRISNNIHKYFLRLV